MVGFGIRARAAAVAVALATVASGAAQASDSGENEKAAIESLNQRVAELEARLAVAPAEGEDAIQESLKKGIPSTKGSTIKFYGTLRLDAIFDDRTFELDVYAALDMTLPGLAAEVSVAQNGDWVHVPNPRLFSAGIGVDGGREAPLA